jgi:hypothetical protein
VHVHVFKCICILRACNECVLSVRAWCVLRGFQERSAPFVCGCCMCTCANMGEDGWGWHLVGGRRGGRGGDTLLLVLLLPPRISEMYLLLLIVRRFMHE